MIGFDNLFRKWQVNYAIIMFACVSIPSDVSCQNAIIIDSLKSIIAKNYQDTNHVNSLNALSEIYGWEDNYEKTYGYASEALKLANDLNFEKGIAVSYYCLGMAELIKRDQKAALISFEFALNLFKQLDTKFWQAKCYNFIGVAYKALNNIPLALDNYFEAIKLNESISNKVELSRNHFNIGNIYFTNHKYEEALKHYEVADKLKVEINDKKGLVKLRPMLANAYLELSNFEKAQEYYELAIEVAEKLNDPRSMGNAYANFGFFWGRREEYDKALLYLNKSKEILEMIGNKNILSNVFHNLGNTHLSMENHELALNNYKSAIKLGNELGDNRLVGICNIRIGHLYRKEGKYDVSFQYDSAALHIFEKIGNQELIVRAKCSIAHTHIALGESKKALEVLQSNLADQIKLNDKSGLIETYNAISSAQIDLKNYKEAIENNSKAMELAKELELKEALAYIYMNTAQIYMHSENYEAALEYNNEAIKIYKKLNNHLGLADALIDRSNLYKKKGDTDEELNCLNIGLKYALEKGNKKYYAPIYLNIGRIKISQNKYDEGLEYIQKANLLYDEMKDTSGIIVVNENKGFLEMKRNNYELARKYYSEVISMSKKYGSISEIAKGYRNLSKIDSALGKPDDALVNYKLYVLYKDSIYSETNRISLNELKAKYESDKKVTEIERLQNEIEIGNLQLQVHQESLRRIKLEKESIQRENLFNLQQLDLLANEKRLKELELEKNRIENDMRSVEAEKNNQQLALLNKESELSQLEIKKQTMLKNSLFAGFAFSMLLGSFAYYNHITRQKLRLQTLRNKIASDLHDDVGSTLSSIAIFSEIAKQQSKDVVPMLDTIGDSSRKMLDAMADIVWTINPENDQFERIILRMRSFAYQLLGAKQIDFEFEVDEEVSGIKLPMEVRKNLYLIFKEATNNMVKYSQADKAHFVLKQDNKHLTLLIRDNGTGFDITETTQGNGLKNMKKRAQEIGGKLRIESRINEGTTIQLKVAV